MLTEHVKNVCKIGQGADTCRYLFMGQMGFECSKVRPDMKKLMDTRVDMGIMIALGGGIGDECEGVTDMTIMNDMDYINKELTKLIKDDTDGEAENK